MSRHEAREPVCTRRTGTVELLIEGKTKDLGGFAVRRVLPAPVRRTIGPFIFFDEMGPADFPPGEGLNVRPHPHIGLATVTFLFAGEILHRDSLGFVQRIAPGAVNLMTAGHGIVHSERTPPDLERSGQLLHGIQIWMALPDDLEEIPPAFDHTPANELPVIVGDGLTTTVIIGRLGDARSPVATHADTLYLEQRIEAGATTVLPEDAAERGIYVVSGTVAVDGCALAPGTMAVLRRGAVEVRAVEGSRIVVIGGAPVGTRHIWWNFVHSSKTRIEQAKQQWAEGGFPPVPDDDDFIPLPSS